MSLIVSFFAAALAAASPAATPASAPQAVAMAAAPQADEDRIICKSVVATGTRFSTKTCKTKSQWDDAAREAHKFTEDNSSNWGCQSGACGK